MPGWSSMANSTCLFGSKLSNSLGKTSGYLLTTSTHSIRIGISALPLRWTLDTFNIHYLVISLKHWNHMSYLSRYPNKSIGDWLWYSKSHCTIVVVQQHHIWVDIFLKSRGHCFSSKYDRNIPPASAYTVISYCTRTSWCPIFFTNLYDMKEYELPLSIK